MRTTARALRDEYSSWEELADDYVLGLRWFRPPDGEPTHVAIATWLRNDASSPWRRVPFGAGT